MPSFIHTAYEASVLVVNPFQWSRPWRRAFVLAAPITFPIWLALWVLVFCVMMGAVVLLIFAVAVTHLLTPIIEPLASFLEWTADGIVSLWSKP